MGFSVVNPDTNYVYNGNILNDQHNFFDMILPDGVQVQYKRRKKIFREGDRNTQFLYIREGWVILSRMTVNGTRQVLDFVLPNSCILASATDGYPVSYTAECLTDVSATVLSRPNMHRLMRENNDFAILVAQLQQVELERAFDHLMNIGSQPGLQRVAFLLAELHQRMGSIKSSYKDVLPLRQQDIANAVGMTSVYANQILKKLQKEGAIRLIKGKPEVVDSGRLYELGEFLPLR